MNEIKDYLVSDNQHKSYLLKLKDGSEVVASIEHDLPDEPLEFHEVGGWDSDIFSKESIESVIMELPDDLNMECYSCGGELNPREALVGEKECKDCIIKYEQLFKYETRLGRTYKYDTIDELVDLYKILGQPICDNLDMDWNQDDHKLLLSSLVNIYGLVYTWSHWDDFQDNPMEYCVVLDGEIVV